MKDLSSLFLKYQDLEVCYPDTLFPLEWGKLLEERCPVCGFKLKRTLRKVYVCPTHRHKPFVIKLSTYDTLCKKMRG